MNLYNLLQYVCYSGHCKSIENAVIYCYQCLLQLQRHRLRIHPKDNNKTITIHHTIGSYIYFN